MLLVTALIVVAALVGNVVPVSAQGRGPSRAVVFALPLAVVLLVIIVIIFVVICMVYRARRGYFCCLQPTPYQYPSPPHDDSDGEPSEEEGGGSDATSALPPRYHDDIHPTQINIAPPDYRDALQDVIVSDPADLNQTRNHSTEEPQEAMSSQPPQETTPPPQSFPQETTPPSPTIAISVEESPEVPADETNVQENNSERTDELEDSSESYDDRTPLNP